MEATILLTQGKGVTRGSFIRGWPCVHALIGWTIFFSLGTAPCDYGIICVRPGNISIGVYIHDERY